MCAGAICFNGTTYRMCGVWLAKNDLDNEVRTLQLLGRIQYCLIINLVSSRKQPWSLTPLRRQWLCTHWTALVGFVVHVNQGQHNSRRRDMAKANITVGEGIWQRPTVRTHTQTHKYTHTNTPDGTSPSLTSTSSPL